ncbi:MAG TPA: TetR/AcrR family transcriptional regulator [Acidimicrobiia bacterium]|nr:TetR/AcrR family transcriptional regulator [Acidimicrobiia bacterium]
MPERNTATKQRILAAAAELFAENGYHGTGMGDLERAVNLGRGALYYHIGNKEALLYEISISLVEEMVTFAEELVAGPLGAEEKLRLLAHRLMRLINDRQSEITVFYREWTWLTGERRQHVLEARDRFEAACEALLEDGTRSGAFAERPSPVLVKGILGLFNYSYLWFRSSGPMTYDAVADAFVDLILHGIAPPQADQAGA